MAQKPLQLVLGKITQVEATVVSAGAGDAGEIVALDSSGRLDVSVLPIGAGPDVALIEASENIGAGKYVNIWNNTGTPNVRLADNSNGRDAHGFLKDAVTTGNMATVYFEGTNDDLGGLTAGVRQYLGTAGGITSTPPTFAGGATISQFVGYAISATEINTDIDDEIVLA
jgi:hypothetical protein